MKAKIWKSPDTGQWCFHVPSAGAGDRPTWGEARDEVFALLDERQQHAVRM